MSKSKQLAINMIGLVVALMSQWLISVIIPRIGGFNDAGYFTIGMTFGNTLLTIALYNMRAFQVADSFREYSKGTYILSRIITIVCCTIICIVGILIFDYTYIEEKVIVLYWLYRAFTSFIDIFYGFWQAEDKLYYVGIMNTLDGIISFISFMGMYCFSHDIVKALETMLICDILILSIMLITFEHKIKYDKYCRIKRKNVYILLKRCTPLMVASALPVALNAIPKIILREYYTSQIVGIFGSISAPTIFITTFTNGLIAPYIISFKTMKNQNNPEGQRLLIYRLIRIITIVCIFFIFISFLFGTKILVWFYGLEISNYAHVLEILICAMMFNSIYVIYMNFFVIHSKNYMIMRASFIGLVSGLGLCLILIQPLSIWGAAIALMIAYFNQCLIMFYEFKKWIDLNC